MKFNPANLGNYSMQNVGKKNVFPFDKLSDEQKDFVNLAKTGKNILVDACIGSGKTTAIQVLCNEMKNKTILYLTYNKLLKLDAQSKIVAPNVTVSNYHGFAYSCLMASGIKSGISDLIQNFNKYKPKIRRKYDMIVIDEYQDIEQEIAEMLDYIKKQFPSIQIVAVGDMAQKIYDKTTLNVVKFIDKFLGKYETLHFTQCFRLSPFHAERLGKIWQKDIKGVNPNCKVVEMPVENVVRYLAEKDTSEILCLGSRTGSLSKTLNILEELYPQKFNKKTVYASISDNDKGNTNPDESTAIFTTFDSSKGLERKTCIVFDYTEDYWDTRVNVSDVNYEILRNIFLVAASRGKDEIIFVNDHLHNPLTDRTISTPPVSNVVEYRPFDVSSMFDFKYKEDVEDCFKLLGTKQINMPDKSKIKVNNEDGLIDLSPCIGIYQEAVYFNKYNIDEDIQFAQDMNKDYRPPLKIRKFAPVDEKILYLTAYKTYQDRYIKQVTLPFITDTQSDLICDRLSTVFNKDETVQVRCDMCCGELEIRGIADVVKNDEVYELKFVQELTHEHYLQCAMYMISMRMTTGYLWNVRSNEMYEIHIPNRKAFMKNVIKTITKGRICNYQLPEAFLDLR